MVAACEAAIDTGIFYLDDFKAFVFTKMGGYDCEAVLLKDVLFDDNRANFAELREKVTSLENEVAASPRGTYALFQFVRAEDNHHYWKFAVSDGSGGLGVGGRYNTYAEAPTAIHVLAKLVGHEIYKCRQHVENLREIKASQEAIDKHRIMPGMTVKNFTIPGSKPYSTAVVMEVSRGNGFVKLRLTKRGSRKRYESPMQARFFARYAGLADSGCKEVITEGQAFLLI